ncbi:Hypothetical protein D9617_9g024430 [Elsinoe fawcettii]|nr:Hypothetical protein D9617_9g024430 [Elsinoe fawcettii]
MESVTPPITDQIRDGGFWTLSEDDFLEAIHNAFTEELLRLSRAPAASERTSINGDGSGSTSSPSRLLLNQESDEVNRTLVSILAARWLWIGDYDKFTRGQDDDNRLTRKEFDGLANWFRQTVKSPDDQLLLVTLLIIHDLGKDPQLAKDIKTGLNGTVRNHDQLVYQAVDQGLVPIVYELNRASQDALLLCLSTSSTLSIGQLIQAENVPGSLVAVEDFKGPNSHYFDIKFFEQILDVAGAMGHEDHSSAKTYTSPVHDAFATAYKSLKGIVDGHSTFRQGYDEILEARADLLGQKGFSILDVAQAEDRALLRLLVMSRTTTMDQAESFQRAFSSLDSSVRQPLVDGLNVDGINDGDAIIPYYMPALFQTALKAKSKRSPEHQLVVLASLMRFLCRALAGAHPQSGRKSRIVERHLLSAKAIIQSEDFDADPTMLDGMAIPE